MRGKLSTVDSGLRALPFEHYSNTNINTIPIPFLLEQVPFSFRPRRTGDPPVVIGDSSSKSVVCYVLSVIYLCCRLPSSCCPAVIRPYCTCDPPIAIGDSSRKSVICCLLSGFYFLLSTVYCLLSAVCLLPAVCYLAVCLSTVYLLSVCCLLSCSLAAPMGHANTNENPLFAGIQRELNWTGPLSQNLTGGVLNAWQWFMICLSLCLS
jgi:hypothetical protein